MPESTLYTVSRGWIINVYSLSFSVLLGKFPACNLSDQEVRLWEEDQGRPILKNDMKDINELEVVGVIGSRSQLTPPQMGLQS